MLCSVFGRCRCRRAFGSARRRPIGAGEAGRSPLPARARRTPTTSAAAAAARIRSAPATTRAHRLSAGSGGSVTCTPGAAALEPVTAIAPVPVAPVCVVDVPPSAAGVTRDPDRRSQRRDGIDHSPAQRRIGYRNTGSICRAGQPFPQLRRRQLRKRHPEVGDRGGDDRGGERGSLLTADVPAVKPDADHVHAGCADRDVSQRVHRAHRIPVVRGRHRDHPVVGRGKGQLGIVAVAGRGDDGHACSERRGGGRAERRVVPHRGADQYHLRAGVDGGGDRRAQQGRVGQVGSARDHPDRQDLRRPREPTDLRRRAASGGDQTGEHGAPAIAVQRRTGP